jgi:hypothetical protein
MAGFENGEKKIDVADAATGDASGALHSDVYGRPTEPTGGGDTNINRNTAAASASADTNIKTNFTSVTAPSFAVNECGEALSGGLGYMGAGLSIGGTSLNGKCEERKNFKAICGDANEKTELALKALALSAQLPDTRIESHQARGIANDQANLAMDANNNCFDRMEIKHQPQQHIVGQPAVNPEYATKKDVKEAEDRSTKRVDQAFKHSQYK